MPPGLVDEIVPLWQAGRFEELQQALARHESVLAGAIRFLVANRARWPAEVLGERAGELASRALRQQQQRAYPLAVVATVAPIVGLLGTVVGMIEAFHVIAFTGGMGDASLLAGGISKALVNTAAGLSVALPALALHHFFRHRLTVGGARARGAARSRARRLRARRRPLMRIDVGEEEQPEISLIALIDCIFFLLMFFMVATSFQKQAEGKAQKQLPITLPESAVSLDKATADPSPVVIGVDVKGGVYWGREPVTTVELRERLHAEAQRDPEPRGAYRRRYPGAVSGSGAPARPVPVRRVDAHLDANEGGPLMIGATSAARCRRSANDGVRRKALRRHPRWANPDLAPATAAAVALRREDPAPRSALPAGSGR